VITAFFFILGIACAAPDAATEKTGSKSQQSQPAADKKSTDMSFDELLVQGKYHFTGEAVTTVEQDKVLDGLLQVRKDFKDRIQQSAARY
jgi:hypothetical protein